jgi:DNA processing protein
VTGACDACLRRSHVIATLAARIEGLLQKPSQRIGNLLALSSEKLIEALVPDERGDEVLSAIAGFDPDHAREQAAEALLDLMCPHARAYPDALRGLADSPPVLWARGGAERLTELLDGPGVAVVGSRRPSAYGIEVAEELSRGLSAAGVTVVSGLALGIDAAAHRGALRAPNPRTIAVLGGGADVVYPRMNRRIYERIAEVGVVLSESPPGRRPFRWTFPARNRIMAALGRMTVVVEARERSGSLITADLAEQLNREVGAVPGRVGTSPAAGTNALLHDGAHVIRGAQDVLDALIGPGAGAANILPPRGPALEEELERVLDLVERGSSSADALARASGLAPGPLAAALVQLELSGYLRSDSGGRYERTSLAAPSPA